MAPIKDDLTIRDHWRCFLACGLVILSPFQYGIDFGLIGGLQAMPGFLKVKIGVLLDTCEYRSMLSYYATRCSVMRPPIP